MPLPSGTHVSDVREDGEEGEGAVQSSQEAIFWVKQRRMISGGPVVLVTADRESYSCVLPNVGQEGWFP